MVSEDILRERHSQGIEYVVGFRMTEAAEDAISYTGANWQDIERLSIRVKPMGVDGETYIVCHNPGRYCTTGSGARRFSPDCARSSVPFTHDTGHCSPGSVAYEAFAVIGLRPPPKVLEGSEDDPKILLLAIG